MTRMIFGGVTAPLGTDIADGADVQSDVGCLLRLALIDRFDIDFDSALVSLGAAARAFHGIGASQERIGLSRFLDCYDPECRPDLLRLIENVAGTRRPFHFTVGMAAPVGAFVHGFIAPAEGSGAQSAKWSGVLVMTRLDPREPLVFAEAS